MLEVTEKDLTKQSQRHPTRPAATLGASRFYQNRQVTRSEWLKLYTKCYTVAGAEDNYKIAYVAIHKYEPESCVATHLYPILLA